MGLKGLIKAREIFLKSGVCALGLGWGWAHQGTSELGWRWAQMPGFSGRGLGAVGWKQEALGAWTPGFYPCCTCPTPSVPQGVAMKG